MLTKPQWRICGLAMRMYVVFTVTNNTPEPNFVKLLLTQPQHGRITVVMVSKVMQQFEIILLSLKGLCFIPVEANRK